MANQERRAHPRFPVWIPGLLAVMAPDRPELIRQRPMTVVDLSERGAMVSLHLEPELLSVLVKQARQCRLSFAPSTGLPTQISGRVVWSAPALPGETEMKIGLFFENCPSEVLTELRRFLSDGAATSPLEPPPAV